MLDVRFLEDKTFRKFMLLPYTLIIKYKHAESVHASCMKLEINVLTMRYREKWWS